MPAEHRAILLLLALAAGGQGLRQLLGRPGDAPGAIQILPDSRRGSPLAHRDSAVQVARPLAPGERIDPDRAGALELARLPRVGPALARTIVADRSANGPFGSLEALDRVPGVGPGLLRGLTDHVRFSAPDAPPIRASGSKPAGAPLDLNAATPAQLDALPGIGPAKAQAIVRHRDSAGRFGAVSDLGRLPGFGPALVLRLQGLVVAR
ncbi:MAG: helix-hairpin-helix domain-containing protein [Gemmatimonadales bacterium]|nr:helix-hairpin-helix domain-containing protein [Gemmatimonadales bacterium]